MNYKQIIITKIVNKSVTFSAEEYKILNKISYAIDYAWQYWDDKIIAPYFDGEKPLFPTEEFIKDWVNHEDFEADGYDVGQLKEIFS